jgi:hypothetical protein
MVSDREVIQDLFARYAYARDTPDRDLLASLFTETVSFSFQIADGPAVSLVGLRDLLTFMDEAQDAREERRRHLFMNIWQDSDSSAFAVVLLLGIDRGHVRVRGSGEYRTRVERNSHGSARFSQMDIRLDSSLK